LLANPRSSRFARQPEAMRAAAAGFRDAVYREACDPPEIGRALRELEAEGADIIIVLGGDGTLQSVLDQLPGETAIDTRPLAVVPCGSTNMTAMDVGCRHSPARTLRLLRDRLDAGQTLPTVVRPVLRLRRKEAAPLCGMFFGAGIITDGVRYFRERVRGGRIIGEAASGLAMLRMLSRLVTDGARAAAVRAGATEQGRPLADGTFLLLFATTLERLLFGLRPYWGTEQAAMHFTAIRDRPARFWRSLPHLARGRGHRLDPRDFHSRNLHTLDLDLAGDFVLDGEIHANGAGDRVLRMDAGRTVRFAVP
jgi:hypothetical protein